ncbi:MAG: cell wall metabolism sensor histidine kinase WalK [candidate division KSB1 bacterium]|nr:cell wall metabolism sensor histidine kinase WalK [candidate division KSB1 bacterium]MDZ7304514.1 cell wall metabolism sensor histidine kinase WalK [candidate division KSB1 bacterium]MDZ7313894.1 cell wall metabolism sensor histidine kinase WalK [candidate division KSB1 bacterium]
MIDFLFFKRKTIFRKVFFITLLSSLLPLIVLWLFLLRDSLQGFQPISALSVVFYIFFLVATLLATTGSYYLSKRISQPITHFTRTATEIARGNFDERVNVDSQDELGRLAKIFNYMTEELYRLRKMDLNRIINEKKKTDTIIKNIADGVIVTDPANCILVMNSVMETWFGIKEKDSLNKPLEQCISNNTLLQFIRNVQSDTAPKTPTTEIVIKSTKTWKDIFLQAHAARVLNEQNELIGIVTILRDITREKEIDRMKTELVSMVAHELRSPLTSISGFSELLLDPAVNREQSEEYAAIILKESIRLSDLINKFLDISRIEAGKSQAKRIPMQIRDVVDKVLDVNLHQAEKKGIVVSVKVSPELPLVFGDPDMLEQVILNLFTNAVKYSPENTAIEIRLKERENDVLVEVEDNGYGISEKSLPRIFEKFYRVTDNEKVREITGTGLGLALVKEIVEIHGGTISVRSKLGEGSTFWFTIPKYTGRFHDLEFEASAVDAVSGAY